MHQNQSHQIRVSSSSIKELICVDKHTSHQIVNKLKQRKKKVYLSEGLWIMREHVDDSDRFIGRPALERAPIVRRKDQESDDGDNEESGEKHGACDVGPRLAPRRNRGGHGRVLRLTESPLQRFVSHGSNGSSWKRETAHDNRGGRGRSAMVLTCASSFSVCIGVVRTKDSDRVTLNQIGHILILFNYL